MGDFSGLHKYKSFVLEVKHRAGNIYYGGYIKQSTKTVNSKEVSFIYVPISYDRNFKGNALAVGATTGVEVPIGKKFKIDFNMLMGYGRYYKMTEEYPYNLPSPRFFDMRVAVWIGFRL